MQIELTGPTMAGKSTLAGAIPALGRESGIDIIAADAFILGRLGLNGIGNKTARTLIIDVIALATCLVHWRRYRPFIAFSLGMIRGLVAPISIKANLARNILKKVGIHAFIAARTVNGPMVLVDEGTLHAAHNLFVHENQEPDLNALGTFVALVPRPQMVFYMTQSETVIVDRLIRDGHKRITGDAGAKQFAARAVRIFDALMQDPDLRRTVHVTTIDGNAPNADRDRMVIQALRESKAAGDPADWGPE